MEQTSYPGGKAASGVYQKIINLMPPHRVYVEGFLGGGAIMKAKRTAQKNIGVEIDRDVYHQRIKDISDVLPFCYLYCCEFLEWLKRGEVEPWQPDTLIYLDPPYLLSTRSSKRAIYKHEMLTEEEHADLITAIKPLPAMVMISGYDSELYNEMLADWRRVEFTGVSRGGPTVEVVWCNFAEPAELHDYRFLGNTYRERQDIRRQQDRWKAKLAAMPSQRRYAILAATNEFRNDRTGVFADNRSIIGEDAVSRESAALPLPARDNSRRRPSADLTLSNDGRIADTISP